MIKGVNKRIVEVKFPESVYFEKAVIFLRSDMPPTGDVKLAAEAKNSISALETDFSGQRTESIAMLKFRIWAGRIFRGIASTSAVICAVYVLMELADRFV